METYSVSEYVEHCRGRLREQVTDLQGQLATLRDRYDAVVVQARSLALSNQEQARNLVVANQNLDHMVRSIIEDL